MTSTDSLAVFASVFVALYTAHMVGDHWIQSPADACAKARAGWDGRLACARHVLSMTVTKSVALLALTLTTGLNLNPYVAIAGLSIDAVSHYWADRRTTLAQLAAMIPGKTSFYQLGTPRPGHDDNPCLGTGAYALDQSWHIGWLFIAALIIAA
jgi:hypothetical protein